MSDHFGKLCFKELKFWLWLVIFSFYFWWPLSAKPFAYNKKNYHFHFQESSAPTNSDLGPEDQRLALHLLNNKKFNGFPLVGEHIESRVLRNPLQPNTNQVKFRFLYVWSLHSLKICKYVSSIFRFNNWMHISQKTFIYLNKNR